MSIHYSYSEIEELVQVYRRSKDPIIFTNGVFDMFHFGHLDLLTRCKKKFPKSRLIVGVNSDASVKLIKGEFRPIISQHHRAEIINALNVVDAVIVFDEQIPQELIKIISPEYIVKGDCEYTQRQLNAMIKLITTEVKPEFINFPKIPGLSTTVILTNILSTIH